MRIPPTLQRLLSVAIFFAAVLVFSGSETSQLVLASVPVDNFTVSGTVTDSNGAPLAGVAMVLQNDPNGTQITFTDQSGNYVFNFTAANRLTVSASKANYIFNPLAVSFIFPSGSRTQSFVGTQSPIPIPFGQIPVLLTQENSLRSAALDSVMLTSEAFGITNTNNLSSDQRGRVSLFAASFNLWPNEPASVITAQAEDSLGNVFPLTIEAYSPVPNFPWLKQIVVKLPVEIANKNEVSVSISLRGASSNKVIVKVKP